MTTDGVSAMDVAAVVADAQQFASTGQLTLANGVVLGFRTVPRAAFREVLRRIPIPEPPEVYIESRGRTEPNPSDPDYLKAVETAHDERLLAAERLWLALGVEIVSVPESMEGPESDDWIEELRLGGIEINDASPAARRIGWLDYRALNAMSRSQVMGAAMRATGILEQEVMDSIDFFRGSAQRRADNGGDAPAHD